MQMQRLMDSDAWLKTSMSVIAFFVLVSSSFVAIPIEPVPITMQTLAVTLTGVVLGARLGPIVVMVWLIAGWLGLPVLAMGNGGLDELVDPTAGYLYSFPLIAWVAAKLDGYRSSMQSFFALLTAHALCLVLGAAWLAMYVGFRDAIILGIVPFMIGAVLKSLLGTLILLVIRS